MSKGGFLVGTYGMEEHLRARRPRHKSFSYLGGGNPANLKMDNNVP